MFKMKSRARVFIYQRPADLRKGFGGLFNIIVGELGQDIFRGDLFVFFNKNRSLAKIMFCDDTGFCIFSKKLVENRFSNLWTEEKHNPLRISKTQLQYLLQGASLKKVLLEK